MTQLAVFTVQPGPPATAGWVRMLLAPAIQAARIEKPAPIELRPCGHWAGWAAGPDLAPDGRVCIDSQARFWSRDKVILIYLHESAHQMLRAAGDDASHAASFFAMQHVLLQRLDLAQPTRPSAWADAAKLYDLQDPPEPLEDEPRSAWLPRALGWAIAVADELAPGQASAEECAAEISARYAAWCEDLAAEPARIAAEQQAAAIARKKAEVQRAALASRLALTRERLSLWRYGAGYLAVLLVGMLWSIKW